MREYPGPNLIPTERKCGRLVVVFDLPDEFLFDRRAAWYRLVRMAEINDDLANRLADFADWCKFVRDPAYKLSEGQRWIRSKDGKTTICYEIAPLAESRFAFRYRMEYGSGSMSGLSSPWSVCSSRQECIDTMLRVAKGHFGRELVDNNCNVTQQDARKQMLELLEGGLFGFIEPDVEATKE